MNRQVIMVFLLASITFAANGYIDIYSGVSWPRTLEQRRENRDKVMGTVGLESGRQFGSVVSLGAVFEYSFKGRHQNITEEISSDSTGLTEITIESKSVRRKLLSTGMGVCVSPLKGSKIRPAVHANLLPTMMILVNDFDTLASQDILPKTGVYWGILSTVESHVQFSITEEVSFFLGGGYRFGSVRKPQEFDFKDENAIRTYYRQSMEGVVLRLGITCEL